MLLFRPFKPSAWLEVAPIFARSGGFSIASDSGRSLFSSIAASRRQFVIPPALIEPCRGVWYVPAFLALPLLAFLCCSYRVDDFLNKVFCWLQAVPRLSCSFFADLFRIGFPESIECVLCAVVVQVSAVVFLPRIHRRTPPLAGGRGDNIIGIGYGYRIRIRHWRRRRRRGRRRGRGREACFAFFARFARSACFA